MAFKLPELKDFPPDAVFRTEDLHLTADPREAYVVEYTRLEDGEIVKVLEPVGMNKALMDMFDKVKRDCEAETEEPESG